MLPSPYNLTCAYCTTVCARSTSNDQELRYLFYCPTPTTITFSCVGPGNGRPRCVLQVVLKNGEMAVNFEHSFSDGMAWSRMLGEVNE